MKSFKFIDTKRFSPVATGVDLPHAEDYFHKSFSEIDNDFLDSGDYIIDEVWWYEQRRRCIEGYTVKNAIVPGGEIFVEGLTMQNFGPDEIYLPELDIIIKDRAVHITGKHYFYLNFWWIKAYNPLIGRKDLIKPRFTDLSFENWHIRERMRKENKDNLWIKSRQKGFSEEEACDTAIEALFNNNSQSAILGGEEKYNKNTMNFVKRGLGRIVNTQFYKILKPDREDYIRSVNTGSEIYSRTMKDNAQGISGLSPSAVKYEEVGIWKKGLVTEAAEFIKPSQEAEGHKTGWNTYIATGGEDESGVDNARDMFYKPAKYNLLEFANIYEDDIENSAGVTARFVPAWKFELTDNDGNSLKAASIAKILKEREEKDDKERTRFITQKPLKPSEVFLITGGGYLDSEIIDRLNKRRGLIMRERSLREKIIYSELYWVLDDGSEKGLETLWLGGHNYPIRGVVDKPMSKEDGPYKIIERPKKVEGRVPDHLYKGATDSYDKDEANTSSSKGSCHIKKTFYSVEESYNKYVASLIIRPDKAEIFHEMSAKLMIFYNALNLIEWSNILIFKWYEDHGLDRFLRERPELATAAWIKNSMVQNKFGIDPATKPHWLKLWRDSLWEQANIDKLDDPEQIEAFIKYKLDPKYNCDITISSALAEVHAFEDQKLAEENRQRKERMKDRKPIFEYKTVDGVMQLITAN